MIQFWDLGSNILLTEFDDMKEKERVMRDGPWTFDKSLVLVKEFNNTQQGSQLEFNEACFWIRIYDLPLMTRNEYIGKLVSWDKLRKLISRMERWLRENI